MFGKLFKGVKRAVHQGKKLAKSAIHEGVKTSHFIGKTIDSVQNAYAQGKKFIRHTAVKADHALGTNGAITDLARAGIYALEKNPLSQELNTKLNRVEKSNKMFRKNVLQNKDLNKFVGN